MTHPAAKKVQAMLRKAGFSFIPGSSALELKVISRDDLNHVWLKIQTSAHENKARVEIDWLADSSAIYPALKATFNNVEFRF